MNRAFLAKVHRAVCSIYSGCRGETVTMTIGRIAAAIYEDHVHVPYRYIALAVKMLYGAARFDTVKGKWVASCGLLANACSEADWVDKILSSLTVEEL